MTVRPFDGLKAHDEGMAAIVASVERELTAFEHERGKLGGRDDVLAWHQRRRAAEKAMCDRLASQHGAAFTYRPAHDHAVRLGGVRATSTSSHEGALRNWLRRART